VEQFMQIQSNLLSAPEMEEQSLKLCSLSMQERRNGGTL